MSIKVLVIDVSCVGEEVDVEEREFSDVDEMGYVLSEERGSLKYNKRNEWKSVNDEGFVLVRIVS